MDNRKFLEAWAAFDRREVMQNKPDTDHPGLSGNTTQPRPRASGAISDAEVEVGAEALYDADPLHNNGIVIPWPDLAEHVRVQRRKFARTTLEAVAATSARPAADGWQPIKTAPTDDDGWIKCCLVAAKQEWGWETWVGQRDGPDIWLGRTDTGSCFETIEPTHWRPLPEPPAANEQ